jgi:hypothetical protein
MEGSKHFQDAQLLSEAQAGDAGNLVLASVISTYVPDSPDRSGK